MGFLDNIQGISRKTLVSFFVVDTSGSMTGSKIASVNVALEDTIPELAKLSDDNADSKIKIAMMEFSTGARWITNPDHPEELTDFNFRHFEAGGLTDLGDALNELNRKLSRKAFMKSEGEDQRGYYAPIIFFFSDGSPTDNWEAALEQLKQNNWYKFAIKIAVAIGDDADMSILEKVTGNSECVVKVKDPKQLKKFIKFASITSAQIGSKSSNISDEETSDENDNNSKNDEVGELIQGFINDPEFSAPETATVDENDNTVDGSTSDDNDADSDIIDW